MSAPSTTPTTAQITVKTLQPASPVFLFGDGFRPVAHGGESDISSNYIGTFHQGQSVAPILFGLKNFATEVSDRLDGVSWVTHFNAGLPVTFLGMAVGLAAGQEKMMEQIGVSTATLGWHSVSITSEAWGVHAGHAAMELMFTTVYDDVVK